MDAQRHQPSATAHGSPMDAYNRSPNTSIYAQDVRRGSYTGLSKAGPPHGSHSESHSGATPSRSLHGYARQGTYSSAHASSGASARSMQQLQPLQSGASRRCATHTLASIPSQRHSSGHTAHHSSDRLLSKTPSQRRRSSSASRAPAVAADPTAAAMAALQGSLSQHHMALAGGGAHRAPLLHSSPYDRHTYSSSRHAAHASAARPLTDSLPRHAGHDSAGLTASMSSSSRTALHSRTRRPPSPHALPGKLHADSSASSLRSCSTAMQDPGTAASMMSMLSIGSAMSTTSPHARPQPPSSRHERQRSDALMDTSSSSASCTTAVPTAATQLQRRHIDMLPPLDALRHGGAIAGLCNLGNTCFMNSVLQCLAAVPDVLRFMLSGAAQPTVRDATVAPVYKKLLMECTAAPPHHTIIPRAVRDAMARLDRRWGAGAQQDSHEFLLALLERLQAECDRTPGKPKYRELTGKGSVDEQAAEAAAYAREWTNSWVDDCFGGLLQSTVQCRQCGAESHCFDACMDLGLPVPRVAPGEVVSLEHCLQAFTEREELDAVYRCERCGDDTRRTKALRVYTPPRTLVLHLKRFSHRGSAAGGGALGRRTQFTAMRKDATEVAVPARLSLEPFCNPAGLRACQVCPKYRLIGVSEHAGGMGGGHYTATVRHPWHPHWFHCNDGSVLPADRPAGPSSTAYVLFYRLA